MALAMKAQARKAVAEAETVLLEPVESVVRLQRVWRLVRGSRSSAKLDAVCSKATGWTGGGSSATTKTSREWWARSGSSR